MKKKINNKKIYFYYYIVFFIFLLFIYFLFQNNFKNVNFNNFKFFNNCNKITKCSHCNKQHNLETCNKCGKNQNSLLNNLVDIPNYPPKNYDILHNSYAEPLRDDRIYNYNNFPNSFKIPININTQYQPETNFRQIGILTRMNQNNNLDKETILPLMGKPVLSNRDKWNFYTMNDKNTMIKLPIIHKNKRGTIEQGIDNLYEGDIVEVLGYNDTFKVTIYDNNTMKYIPYL